MIHASTSLFSEVARQFAPAAYFDVAEQIGHPMPHAAFEIQSRGNRCDLLTKSILGVFSPRGLSVRRELHQTEGGMWHFVIAHGSPDSTPSNSDELLDMNPWQFNASLPQKGPLIGIRSDVMETLRSAGAPEEIIALRAIKTITHPHVEDKNPAYLPYR